MTAAESRRIDDLAKQIGQLSSWTHDALQTVTASNTKIDALIASFVEHKSIDIKEHEEIWKRINSHSTRLDKASGVVIGVGLSSGAVGGLVAIIAKMVIGT